MKLGIILSFSSMRYFSLTARGMPRTSVKYATEQ